jgi:hypothetical protein
MIFALPTFAESDLIDRDVIYLKPENLDKYGFSFVRNRVEVMNNELKKHLFIIHFPDKSGDFKFSKTQLTLEENDESYLVVDPKVLIEDNKNKVTFLLSKDKIANSSISFSYGNRKKSVIYIMQLKNFDVAKRPQNK